MSFADVWTTLESWPMAIRVGESWWFPLLESIHVLTATFVLGSIAMVDLRLLGLAGREYPIGRITREVVPWTLGACAVSIGVGVALFVSRAGHYAGNVAFQVKMVLLVLAGINMAVFHLVTSRRLAEWDTPHAATTSSARLAGAASLLLWIGVMLAGRWIGHLS
jgi:hypothetical protein